MFSRLLTFAPIITEESILLTIPVAFIYIISFITFGRSDRRSSVYGVDFLADEQCPPLHSRMSVGACRGDHWSPAALQ